MHPWLIKAKRERVFQAEQRMRMLFTAILCHAKLRIHPAIIRKKPDTGHQIARRGLMIMKLVAQPAHVGKVKWFLKRMAIKSLQIVHRLFITSSVSQHMKTFPIIHVHHHPLTSACRT